MDQEKETWINNVLGSLANTHRAEPSPFLFAKIRNRLIPEQQTVYVSAKTAWTISASFALLVLLNWQVLNQPATSSTHQADELTTVVSGMQLYPTTNQLYDVWSEQNY